MEQELKEFYREIVQCPLGTTCGSLGIENNPGAGMIPRGFYTRFYEPKKILVVAINPGRPNPKGDEAERYLHSADPEEEQHKTVEQFAKSGERFQAGLQEAVRTVLRLDPQEDIYKHVGFTNLVKCQCDFQYRRFGMLPPNNKLMLMENCYAKWFSEEIGILCPRLILAYSIPAKFFLEERIRIKVVYLPRRGAGNFEIWRTRLKELAERMAWVQTPEYLPRKYP